jgi:adenylate cyclase
MSQTRRVAANVAGYSRLEAAPDEEGTLRRLKAIRDELVDPAIAAHYGRLVKDDGRRAAGRIQQCG